MNNQQGFTLVETLLYLAMMTVVLGAVSAYIYSMLRAEFRHQETSQLFQDADRVHRLLTYDIRVAQRVLNPALFSTSSTLSLEREDGTRVVYEFVSSGLWRSEDTDAPERVTTPETLVRSFTVLHTGTTSSPGMVDVTTTFHRGTTLSNSADTSVYSMRSAALIQQ